MIVKKRKVKIGFWKFTVGKVVIAITKKKKSKYSLVWKVPGLLKVMRKMEMKGVIIGSQWYPGDFTNYSQSNEKFSSKYIKKTINRALKNYIRRKKRYEEIRNIPKISL